MLRSWAPALLAAAALALQLPHGWSIRVELARCERGGPQSCVIWAGGERLWRAARRLLWLALAKRLAAWRLPLCVAPQQVRAHGAAVLLEVAVTWLGVPVPWLNTQGPHHVTLCRCPGAPEAAAVAAQLAAASAPWLWEKGVIRRQLARELSLCRTARVVEGMSGLVRALREETTRQQLAFEPDARGVHVSL